MRVSEQKVVAGLVGATMMVALVALASITSTPEREVELFQQATGTTELKTDHYVPPNPFEDPELRKPYKVDVSKEKTKSKSDFDKAEKKIKDGMKIMEAVLKDLTAQDKKRDALMDKGLALASKIHSVRHLLIMVKDEVEKIRVTDDGNWIFKNPFGRKNDPPRQDLSPFKKQVDSLRKKCAGITKKSKALVKETHKCRNAAILLDAKLYDKVHEAKACAKSATVLIHRHNDKTEMFNHKDYDIIHRVDKKLNDHLRVQRHRLHGMFNLAKAMSERQPNEVSEVTALATDLLIVTAETLDRLKRMEGTIKGIKWDRNDRFGKGKKK